jgi:hypothetical protein
MLTLEEQARLDELWTWDEERRPAETMVSNLALLVGGVLIVATIVMTLRELTDLTIRSVLVPGVLAGLFLIALHLFTRARIRERHALARLTRKLAGKAR